MSVPSFVSIGLPFVFSASFPLGFPQLQQIQRLIHGQNVETLALVFPSRRYSIADATNSAHNSLCLSGRKLRIDTGAKVVDHFSMFIPNPPAAGQRLRRDQSHRIPVWGYAALLKSTQASVKPDSGGRCG